MSIFQKICLILTIVGAVNWGLIALFDFDLVAYIFGQMTIITRIIYGLVFIAGVINLALLFLPNEHHMHVKKI